MVTDELLQTTLLLKPFIFTDTSVACNCEAVCNYEVARNSEVVCNYEVDRLVCNF